MSRKAATSICPDEDCALRGGFRGYCKKHYQRRYTAGEFKGDPRSCRGLPLVERLRKYAPEGEPDECWEWTGYRNKGGYGTITVLNKSRKAHVVAWEIANGVSVPDGLVVRHSCDNPPCTNPRHLLTGTQADNAIDAVLRNRQPFKIRADDVNPIRRKIAAGEAVGDIAREYGVTDNAIYDLKNDKTWWYVMKEYQHRPIEVRAMQAGAPWDKVISAFPRSHLVKLPSGKVSYLHIVDAVGRTRAYANDWIVKYEDGTVEVLPEEEFTRRHEAVE